MSHSFFFLCTPSVWVCPSNLHCSFPPSVSASLSPPQTCPSRCNTLPLPLSFSFSACKRSLGLLPAGLCVCFLNEYLMKLDWWAWLVWVCVCAGVCLCVGQTVWELWLVFSPLHNTCWSCACGTPSLWVCATSFPVCVWSPECSLSVVVRVFFFFWGSCWLCWSGVWKATSSLLHTNSQVCRIFRLKGRQKKTGIALQRTWQSWSTEHFKEGENERGGGVSPR